MLTNIKIKDIAKIITSFEKIETLLKEFNNKILSQEG